MTGILVVNSGSSSLKYQFIDMTAESVLASGLIERVTDHVAACRIMIGELERLGLTADAVGHRVVHGGSDFSAATLVDDGVLARIDALAELAPLHNPANLDGIRAVQDAFPGIPQVAVFDTAFHQTLAPEAYTYAIDRELAEQYRVRRYGFHGTSHRFVSGEAARFLGRPLDSLKQIVLHLGNGASACAIDGGRSVDTSMGLTPLAGLVMGTRSGDLDPAVLLHLMRRAGLGADELDELLNTRSGLLGLSGHADWRDVQAATAAGDERAALAAQVFRRRITHYVGAYAALLGGLDVVSFTAGIGEHSAAVRAEVLAGLGHLGIELEPERNEGAEGGIRTISSDASRVTVLVVPTNEELEIAREVLALLF